MLKYEYNVFALYYEDVPTAKVYENATYVHFNHFV